MNVEKRIQRLELQNERLKLALIGIGTIIVLTFVVVLKSSVDKPDEAAKKVNTPNLVIAESAVTQNAQDLIMEGESEIVAGFHVEYSGAAFAIFFLAEYANMILISALTAIFFFGGSASPFEGLFPGGGSFLNESSFFWLALKISIFMFVFYWIRATFPRYRYDQIMRLGWKVFIPITIIWIFVEGIMAWLHIGPWQI